MPLIFLSAADCRYATFYAIMLRMLPAYADASRCRFSMLRRRLLICCRAASREIALRYVPRVMPLHYVDMPLLMMPHDARCCVRDCRYVPMRCARSARDAR